MVKNWGSSVGGGYGVGDGTALIAAALQMGSAWRGGCAGG